MKSGKTIETAQRALEILKELMHKEMRVDDILDTLCAERDYGVVYTKEAIYKYLNTFKAIGINIGKNKGCYSVENSFAKINLSQEDKFILNFLENYVCSVQNNEYQKNFNRIKELIKKNNTQIETNVLPFESDRLSTINKKYKNYSDIIAQLEKSAYKKENLIITYKLSEDETVKYAVVPDKIIFKNGYLILCAFNREHYEYSNLLVENIVSIDFTPQIGLTNFYKKAIVFKLTGELAKNYHLKKNEEIKEFNENYIIVSNKGENTTELTKRLFRYGENCEIFFIPECRKFIKEKIENSLALYKD